MLWHIFLSRAGQRAIANGKEPTGAHITVFHNRIDRWVWYTSGITKIVVFPSREQILIASLAPILKTALDFSGYGFTFAIAA
jgi:hypothetical protein